MQGWLPLFPLQVVLLPDAELPLHIFEDRYKEMIAEVLRDKIEFGVVLANERGIVNTGCTSIPGVDSGTRNVVRPLCLATSGLVRVSKKI